jgi:hypothetical protein
LEDHDDWVSPLRKENQRFLRHWQSRLMLVKFRPSLERRRALHNLLAQPFKLLTRLFPGLSASEREDYDDQHKRLGMALAFVLSIPDLSDTERYGYTKLMLVRSEKTSFRNAGDEIMRQIRR